MPLNVSAAPTLNSHAVKAVLSVVIYASVSAHTKCFSSPISSAIIFHSVSKLI